MRDRYNKQLVMLNNEMMDMCNLIEQAIEQAVSALAKQDVELARKVIDSDTEINRKEKEIENLCMRLLLTQQPVASDMRQISSALKMITDMERIGDHASDISELTILMAEHPYVKKLDYIHKMTKETMIMLVRCIEAFSDGDAKKAREVIEHDDVVDDIFNSIKSEIIHLIADKPEQGEQLTDLLMVAKYLERIGDHATNIAEWVIYAIEGSEDLNH